MPRLNPRSLLFNTLLNLLVPGLGHLFWREAMFGIFIFLVMLLASVLFIVSLLIQVPLEAKLAMYGLPFLFYAFTFFDLARTVKAKRKNTAPRTRSAIIFLVAGLGYQTLSPVAPLNFALRNRPEVFVLDSNSLNPLYSKGDILKASRLSYLVDVFVVKKPILHALPRRYEIVRFSAGSDRHMNGIVVGLPGEEIEIVGGVVVANGLPDIGDAPGGIVLSGDWPLTSADSYSISVATVNLGRIDRVHEVPLRKLVGKVSKLF